MLVGGEQGFCVVSRMQGVGRVAGWLLPVIIAFWPLSRLSRSQMLSIFDQVFVLPSRTPESIYFHHGLIVASSDGESRVSLSCCLSKPQQR